VTDFAYTAIPLANAAAGSVTGRRAALDERALRDELRRQGLIAVDVRPVRVGDALRARLSGERLRRGEGAWFFQTLSLLLANNVPVESALATMQELAPRDRLARACADVREALRGGASLAEAVEKVDGLAGPQHLALLRSAQETGRLDHAVALIESSIAARERLRRTMVGRLVYPAILLVTAVIVVWLLATFVIPRFAETLQTLGADMPLATTITLVGARWMVWALPALFVLGALAAWVGPGVLNQAQRRAIGSAALRTPLVGSLIWYTQGGLVADILATTIAGGGDVLAGLKQAEDVVPSVALRERLARARKEVREGGDIGDAMRRHGVLPPVAAAIVQAGARSGDLVGVLRRASAVCAEKQDQLAQRLMTFMEPAVILFMAAVVGWVVYSLISGMMAINEAGLG